MRRCFRPKQYTANLFNIYCHNAMIFIFCLLEAEPFDSLRRFNSAMHSNWNPSMAHYFKCLLISSTNFFFIYLVFFKQWLLLLRRRPKEKNISNWTFLVRRMPTLQSPARPQFGPWHAIISFYGTPTLRSTAFSLWHATILVRGTLTLRNMAVRA